MKTCIFINSCDKTHDVAKIYLKGHSKYIQNNSYKTFIGINKLKHDKKYDFLNYVSCKASDWKNETISQLSILKNEYKYTNVILVLDDFIFNKKIDCTNLNFFLDQFKKKSLKYLSLKNHNESFLISLINKFYLKNKINKLRNNYPYYSSLQIAIWDIDYLINNIKISRSIWDFETLKNSDNHYHVKYNYFSYQHIVEKGEWNYYSPIYVRRYIGDFNPGKRKVKKDLFGFLIFNIRFVCFFLFGFSLSRIRKFFF